MYIKGLEYCPTRYKNSASLGCHCYHVVVVFLAPGGTKMEGPSLRGTGKGQKPNLNAAIATGCTCIWANEGASLEAELPTLLARQEMEGRCRQVGKHLHSSGRREPGSVWEPRAGAVFLSKVQG